MTKRLLITALLGLTIGSIHAQADRFSYAVTDMARDGKTWIGLRKLDHTTGNYSDIIFDGRNDKAVVKSASKGNPFLVQDEIDMKNAANLAFANGVAALAYDKKNNRLFYVPQNVDQLRYIDLNTNDIYYVENRFSQVSGKNKPEQISRMVIAGDGRGYTISNDGNHLYSFTTKGVPALFDLGGLQDASTSELAIVNNTCTSAGGDLIADDEGNLYLISAYNNVFKIKIETRESFFLGKIDGVGKTFLTNAATVDQYGKLIIGSTVTGEPLYAVDPISWKASSIQSASFSCADFANSNLLSSKNTIISGAELSGNIRVYPNPVQGLSFNINFSNMEPGNYQLQISDISGRMVLSKNLNLKNAAMIETIQLPESISKGMFIIKLQGSKENALFIQKLMVRDSY